MSSFADPPFVKEAAKFLTDFDEYTQARIELKASDAARSFLDTRGNFLGAAHDLEKTLAKVKGAGATEDDHVKLAIDQGRYHFWKEILLRKTGELKWSSAYQRYGKMWAERNPGKDPALLTDEL